MEKEWKREETGEEENHKRNETKKLKGEKMVKRMRAGEEAERSAAAEFSHPNVAMWNPFRLAELIGGPLGG